MKSVCEKGVVLSAENGRARVRLIGDPACRKCGLGELGLCKTGGAGMELDATFTVPVKRGEKVLVVRGGRGPADGSLVVYGLPVLGLFLGALAGAFLFDLTGLSPDAAAALGGFLLMGLSLLPAWLISRRRDRNGDFRPRIRKLEPWEQI